MPVIRIGDDLYDDTTGEYAGPASLGGWPSIVDSDDTALFICRKLSDAETELVAVQKQYDAVIANIAALVKTKQQKVDWLRNTYTPQLEAFAWSSLPVGKDGQPKTKTYRNPFVSVSFVTTKAALKVDDNNTAVQYLKVVAPDAIKVIESPLVSLLPDTIKVQLQSNPDAARAAGFVCVPSKQSVTIKTGVGQ